MRVQYEVNDKLPPLAWAAYVIDGVTTVSIGKYVEHNKKFFVEGAWNGEFIKGDFITSDWFCGTGAIVNDKNITFSTPTHVTYGLYYTKVRGGIALATVSTS